MSNMRGYRDLVARALQVGDVRTTRAVDPKTGIHVRAAAIFGETFHHDLLGGLSFPLMTEKRIFWRGVVEELLWIIRGETNINSLREKGVNIWNEWAYDPEQKFGGRTKPLHDDEQPGDVGPTYGFQWRSWPAPQPLTMMDNNDLFVSDDVYDTASNGGEFTTPIDQLAKVIHTLRTNPNDRRMLVTAWNPADTERVGLPPCHYAFQFGVMATREEAGSTVFDSPPVQPGPRLLNLIVHMRSADIFLGVPFNIASYAALLMMVAHVTGMIAGRLTMTFGDLHLYENHVEQAMTLLQRPTRPLPSLAFKREITSIDDFTFEDFVLEGYDPHPAISAPVAV